MNNINVSCLKLINCEFLNYPKIVKSMLLTIQIYELLPNEILLKILYQIGVVYDIDAYLLDGNTKSYYFMLKRLKKCGSYDSLDYNIKKIAGVLSEKQYLPYKSPNKYIIYINPNSNFVTRYKEYIKLINTNTKNYKFKEIILSYYLIKSISNVIILNLIHYQLCHDKISKKNFGVEDTVEDLIKLIDMNPNHYLNKNKYVYNKTWGKIYSYDLNGDLVITSTKYNNLVSGLL